MNPAVPGDSHHTSERALALASLGLIASATPAMRACCTAACRCAMCAAMINLAREHLALQPWPAEPYAPKDPAMLHPSPAVMLDEIAAELAAARAKFPSSAGSLAALMEEVGELAKAVLDEPWERVRMEAVQVAVMAIRVATEGDPTLAFIRSQRVKVPAPLYRDPVNGAVDDVAELARVTGPTL